MNQFPEIPEKPDPDDGGRGVTEMERRTFLKLGLAVTGIFAGGTLLSAASVADRVFASNADTEETYPYKPHYAMVIAQDKCIDCERCVEACAKTNSVPEYGYRTRILKQVDEGAIDKHVEFIPVLCNQCNNPACTRACPTGATYKDKTNGIVMVDKGKCIGCKTCMSACPFNARYYNEETKAVDKCNFCYDTRLSKGETLTACADICPGGVRNFGDLSDSSSNVYKMVHNTNKKVWVLRPETGVKPNVFYTKG